MTQPLVIAHRTCPRHATENSLGGIQRAAELGADAVEIDVRLASEGVPVLFHDSWAARMAWLPVPIGRLSSRRLTRTRLRGSDETVPLFADALYALPDGLRMAIDTKDPAAADAVVSEVRNQSMEDRVLLWSQYAPALRVYEKELPDVESALLRDTRTDNELHVLLGDARALGVDAVSVHQDVIASPMVAEARKSGLKIYAWLQSFDRHVKDATGMLDGIVTDYPAQTRALLNE